MEMDPSLNVLGLPLEPCSKSPVTGYFRDGHCNTCNQDQGSHTICAVMTDEFLAYSKYVGNDLTTPNPAFGFPGLVAGDKWCLCASRFLQAHDEGCPPQVDLSATHFRALEVVDLEILKANALPQTPA